MKNLLREEINQIQYLFEYKRGVVISEQTDPNAAKKIEYLTSIKEKETDESKKALYEQLIEYYTKIQNGESPESPDKRYTDYIDSKFTVQTADTSTPTLPKVKSEPNMPILGNLTGPALTDAYNVLIGYYEELSTNDKMNFDVLATKSMLKANRDKNPQITLIQIQDYLKDKAPSINLETAYASISDKSKYQKSGEGMSPK